MRLAYLIVPRSPLFGRYIVSRDLSGADDKPLVAAGNNKSTTSSSLESPSGSGSVQATRKGSSELRGSGARYCASVGSSHMPWSSALSAFQNGEFLGAVGMGTMRDEEATFMISTM